MWKYIVTWCIVVMTIEPRFPVPDEFGRTMSNYRYETLENRVRYNNDCGHEKWFESRAEAFAFYERAVNEKPAHAITLDGRLSEVKIDSVLMSDSPAMIRFDPEWLTDTIKFTGQILPTGIEIYDSAVYTYTESISLQFYFDGQRWNDQISNETLFVMKLTIEQDELRSYMTILNLDLPEEKFDALKIFIDELPDVCAIPSERGRIDVHQNYGDDDIVEMGITPNVLTIMKYIQFIFYGPPNLIQ